MSAALASSRAALAPPRHPDRVGGNLASRPASVIRALAPHWGALLALALFLVAGLGVLDDYGVSLDSWSSALRAERNFAFVIGENDDFASEDLHIRLYGPVFDLTALFTDSIFRVESSRGVYISRHLLIHLSFLTGGLFAYLLALRLFRNRLLAVLALLLLLLHPRIYAHSFFNSHDIAFPAMLSVALYLTHRAFRLDSVAAFALLGAAVGILVNLRIMGLILVAAVPALRAFDFAFAQGRAERQRILAATGAFALAAALTHFALMPYFWGDPLARAVEWWATSWSHPHIERELFEGARYRSMDYPVEYLPVWISISSPPFALLLGAIGTAGLLAAAARAPRKALRNGRLRFAIALAVCFALPILVVMLPGGNIYSGWRQMYFVWTPFALLAAFGLQWLASGPRRKRLQAAAYGAAGAGLAATAVSMALIHPHQQDHFNFLVDRVSPEHLGGQYMINHWETSWRQALEWILSSERAPAEGADVSLSLDLPERANVLPRRDAERLTWRSSLDSYVLRDGFTERPDLALHRVKIYGSTLATVERKDDLRAVYEAAARRAPSIEGPFDLYELDGALALIKEPCAPSFLNRIDVTLRATPVNSADLPYWRKTNEAFRYALSVEGALFDGKCAAVIPLPNYPIKEFALEYLLEPLGEAEARERARAARDEGRLLFPADSPAAYDVYLSNGELAYLNDSCDPLETEHLFHLNAFPERVGDLPDEWMGRGYERFHFDFVQSGAFVDGGCAVFFPLPDYPVAGVQTGQRMDGDDGEDLWRAEFLTNPERRWAEAVSGAPQEPAARGVFDVRIADGALVYSKEPCEQADAEARFFLHVTPERVADLPEARRAVGFDNLDFGFFLNGALLDGRCAARRALPDYPVASVRTGQHDGGGEIWSAEFSVQAPNRQ